MTYSTNMNPIQVNYQYVSYNGGITSSANNVNNFTRIINGYIGEDIRYCFYGGSPNKVQAYAASWITD